LLGPEVAAFGLVGEELTGVLGFIGTFGGLLAQISDLANDSDGESLKFELQNVITKSSENADRLTAILDATFKIVLKETPENIKFVGKVLGPIGALVSFLFSPIEAAKSNLESIETLIRAKEEF